MEARKIAARANRVRCPPFTERQLDSESPVPPSACGLGGQRIAQIRGQRIREGIVCEKGRASLFPDAPSRMGP